MKLPGLKLFSTKIVTKIIIAFSIILVLSIATIGFLIYGLKSTEFIMMDKLYTTFIITNLSVETEKAMREFDINLRYFINALEERKGQEAMTYTTNLLSSYKAVTDFLTELKKWIKDEKGMKLIVDSEELFKGWEKAEKDIVKLVIVEDFDAVLQAVGGMKGRLEDYIRGFFLMNMEVKEVANESYKVAQDSIKKVILISVIISPLLIAITILIAIFLSRNISISLSFFKNIFSKGASGDLDVRYPVKARAKDEINVLGTFFNNFMDKVRGVIKEVVDTSNDLGVSSEEVSITISNFADNTQSQAASSEEITATMEEISAGIDNVSDNSQFQYNKLNEFITLMKELSGMINSMATRITETQDLSKRISGQAKAGNESLSMMDMIMSKITESSNKVSEIVDIIDSISDRINLLSLNAAIEAARAGEAGRGFAVVADEISKLADQTATSISDIDSLIKKNKEEIATGMNNVVNTVDNIGSVIDGVEAINDMMNMLFVDMRKQQSANESVNQNAEELRIRSDEVRSASEEQRTAVSEVMKSITNINDLIQASAAGAEEMTANANKLASMAENLMGKVSFFKV